MVAQILLVAPTTGPGIARNSKKRPASPSHSSSSSGGYGAGKRKKVSASSFAQGISMEAMSEDKMVPSDFSTGPVEKTSKPLPFKDPNFVHSGHGLLADYTDPQSKLRFSTTEEFSYIQRLPSDVVTGYLALRKATRIMP
ncbi:INO80 complex subunit C [Myotis brandtii]|uniref:INO80 complex subunit C n=1 Tax=Myotis brandtii TaxID=109478 RepID=S7N160_MYOBR|nr:INO80 complex subunit C [Myotis brandtii]